MDKSNIIKKEMQRAEEQMQYEDNFIARNYWLWVIVAFVAYPLAAIFSALTEGGHVYIRAKDSMGEGVMPWAMTLLVVVLVEGLKFFLGKGVVDDIQAGVFSDKGAKLSLFIVKALGFIAIMAFSVNLSIKGAPVINEKLRKQYKPLEAEYVDIKEINARFDAEVAPNNEKIANYEKTTWKGKIVGDARKMILGEQKIIEGIEARRSTELAKADEENERRRLEYEQKTAENGQWSMNFAGLGEVICIFCLLFIGIYDDGIKAHTKESKGAGDSSPTLPVSTSTNINMAELLQMLQQSGQQNYTQVPPNNYPTSKDDTNRRRIGFRYGDMKTVSPTLPILEEVESEENGSPLPWAMKNKRKAFNVVQRALNVKTDGTKLVDTRYFKSRMKQTYSRSFEYETEEARHYQKCLYLYFRAELEEIGWTINENKEANTLAIKEA